MTGVRVKTGEFASTGYYFDPEFPVTPNFPNFGCRTVTVDGRICETVPEELTLRAGLVAAAEKLKQ